MLILSNGAPKSATSLYCYYTRRFVESFGGGAAEAELVRQNDAGAFEGIGYFVDVLDAESLPRLLKIAQEHGALVVKVHCAMFPELEQALADGRCLMTYGFRDPRDMILSARDHYLRTKNDGLKLEFTRFLSDSEAIGQASYWAKQSVRHLKDNLLHVYRYEDLLQNPELELRRLAEYLKLKVSDERIEALIEEERVSRTKGVNEFNKAALTRYQKEMAPELLDLCHREIGSMIHRMGYEVPVEFATDSVEREDFLHILFGDLEDVHLINFNAPEFHKDRFYRWSRGVSSIWVELQEQDYWCSLDTYGFKKSLSLNTIAIYVNDLRIAEENIEVGKRFVRFIVSSSSLRKSKLQLLTFTSLTSSSSLDPRDLGIPMGSLEMVPLSGQVIGPSVPVGRKRRKLFRKRKKLPEPVLPVWVRSEPSVIESVVPLNAESAPSEKQRLPSVERLIVAHSEINGRHGSGVLMKHFFPGISEYGVLLTGRHYGGESAENRYPIDYLGAPRTPRQKVYAKVLECFTHHAPRQVFIVPYSEKDFHIAIALKDVFQCEVCLHIMDDNHLYGVVREHVIAEALEKVDIVFGISPELVAAYNTKFNVKMNYFPPLIQQEWIGMSEGFSLPQMERPVMIGNVWSANWLERFMHLLLESKVEVDWYANNPDSKQLQQYVDSMEAHGLFRNDPRPEVDLLQQDFGGRSYTIVPSGPLDGEEDPMEKLARLSLPSRVILLVAGGGLPVLVVGSRESAVAQFVLQNDIGCVVPYELAEFKHAVSEITNPQKNAHYRANAKRIAPLFSCSEIEDWIWESTSAQEPVDDRFERMIEQSL